MISGGLRLANPPYELPVQRLVQQELVDQHHCQQARPGKAARDARSELQGFPCMFNKAVAIVRMCVTSNPD